MPLTSSLLGPYRFAGGAATRLERVLAVGRAFLTVSALGAIYLDPSEPARLQVITYSVLLAYAVYSVAVLVYVHGPARLTATHGRILHGLDIAWTAVLTFVSEGPVSPFFLFFLFVVLAAAFRWGFRETVGTAAVTIGVFLVETLVASRGPWSATWFGSIGFDLNSTILRVAYLLMTGALLGYLAEQEKTLRAELAAIADATRQPRVSLGLGGSVAAVVRGLMSTFAARAVVMVIHDHESRRTLRWSLDHAADAGGAPRLHRAELTPHEQAAWLFPDSGRAWHAAVGDTGGAVVRTTEPDVWQLRRDVRELPAALLSDSDAGTLIAVNLGLAGEWQGRMYLVDAAETGGRERVLHFLEALAEHVAPALSNVFLVRRLRARAGAAERARVARELHDGAIQALFGIEMKIEAMRRETPRTAARLEAELGEVQELLRREVLSLRELMQALRPIELDSSDQMPDVIAGLVERFRRESGISARFVSTGRVSLAPARALEIVRIVQEALMNVRKHSRATNVLVRLTTDNGACALVIEDDGCGFEFEGRLSAQELDRRHLGPAIIKERARLAGARLAVDSMPGSGARVELDFSEDSHA